MHRFFQLALDLFDPPAPVAAPPAAMPAEPVDTTPAEPLDRVMAPVHFSHPRASRQARLGDSVVAYELRRMRRKTIGFTVAPEGLVVSAPRWVPLYEVDAAVREKSAWILRKLDEVQERQRRLQAMRVEWKDGVTLPFLGEPVIVVLDPRQRNGRSAGAVLNTAAEALPGVPALTLHVGLPHTADAGQIRDVVQAWLMRQAKRVFTERLDHYAPQLGVRWQRLRLSSASTRWGSASADGAISLNWRLIHFRLPVLDYVVAHELSHLRVMDHSPRFWDTVASVMPDYAQLRHQLKDEALPRWD